MNKNINPKSGLYTLNQDPKTSPGKKPLLDPEVDPESPDENPGINPTTNPERFDDDPEPFLEPEIGDDPDEERKKMPTM